MRRSFIAIVAGFILISVILLSFEKELSNEISILTFSSNYSRLITQDQEIVSIPVYLNSDRSFLTTIEAVESASLDANQNILETEIVDIRYSEYSDYLEGDEYFLYYFDLIFPNSNITNYFIELDNAYLDVIYENGDLISLEVGELNLRFSDIDSPGYIEMYRMYALTDDETGSTCGIVIGLRNKTISEITVNRIDVGYSDNVIDLGQTSYLDEEPSSCETVDALGIGLDYEREYDTSSIFGLNQDKLLWLPIRYTEGYELINRFPLVIGFHYQDGEYEYLIDDFQFFTSDHTLVGNYGKLREYIYRYQ